MRHYNVSIYMPRSRNRDSEKKTSLQVVSKFDLIKGVISKSGFKPS